MRFKLFNKHIYIVSNSAVPTSTPTRSGRTNWATQSWTTWALPFATIAEQTALTQIFSRVEKAKFKTMQTKTDGTKPEQSVLDLINFVEANATQILFYLYKNGWVVINYKDLTICENQSDLKKLRKNTTVFYSDTYNKLKRSDSAILKPLLRKIDTLENADSSLIENYGAMGIISPRSEKIRDTTREIIQRDYAENYGITFGKWKMIIADEPLDFTQVRLPIRDLQIREKSRDANLKLIAYFDIPKDLHPLFENATYQNARDKEVQFYSNIVSTYADKLLKILDYLAILNGKILEFWYDFENVYSLESRKYLTVQRTREEWTFWNQVIASEHTTEAQVAYAKTRIQQLLETL